MVTQHNSNLSSSINGRFLKTCISLSLIAILTFFFPPFKFNPLSQNPFSKNLSPKHGLNCNIFNGSWIQDRENYPLYTAKNCPFAEKGFSCLENGRRDADYTKWRWDPRNCLVPRFNSSAVLSRLAGKRVVFVGDSVSRTQWESAVCMLMTGVEEKSSVYEVGGRRITKTVRFLRVRFGSYNISVDFYRSVFLMRTDSVPAGAPRGVRMTVRLDDVDDISDEWVDSDVLVFNSGHWWTENRLFREMGCYFRIGNSVEMGMGVAEGFRRAMNTWASWAEAKISPNRTMLFFRTFESTHWSGNNKCKVSRWPSSKANGRDKSEISEIIMDTLKKMKIPVTIMHLTPMGAYRSDGHVGTWSDNPSLPDCTHWCLPGLPDIWNEILFSYLLP